MSGRSEGSSYNNPASLADKPFPRVFLILLLAMAIGWLPEFRSWSDRLVFDSYSEYSPRPYDPNVPVRIIAIDEASLSRLGQWPWPRSLLAQLVTRLSEMGASVVALDMFFPEPDRLSPNRVLSLWRKTMPGWQPGLPMVSEWPGQQTSFDQMLAGSFSSVSVILGMSLGSSGGRGMPKILALEGDLPGLSLGNRHMVSNLPLLAEAAWAEAPVMASPDPDGIIRRLPLWVKLSDKTAAGFAFAATLARLGGEPHTAMTVRYLDGLFLPMPDSFYLRNERLRVTGLGELAFWDTGSLDLRYIPAWQILAKGPHDFLWEPSDFQGTLIFVGVTAAGLYDQQWAPTGRIIPGVELHAQLAEQLLLGQQIYWPQGAEWLVPLLSVLVALGLIWLSMERSRVLAAWVLLGVLALASVGLGLLAFTRLHWIINPVIPISQWLLVLILATGLRYIRVLAEKRELTRTFSHYLSPDRVEQLVNHPEHLRLGGDSRTMTLMFSDVRNFTRLSESLEAEALITLMNDFLTPLSDAVMANKGCIDKYMGDCIMAFWNAPLDDPEHAANACKAALHMRQALAGFNERRRQAGESMPLAIGIGINTGDCCVGNMGSRQRFDYSVIGDSVNLASRLEGLSAYYGVGTVIGEGTAHRVRDWALLELDLVRVKGKAEPVRVFALLGDTELAANAGFRALAERHESFLRAYRNQDWAAATEMLSGLQSNYSGPWDRLDSLYQLYADRIEGYRREPPGPQWQGVHVMQTK